MSDPVPPASSHRSSNGRSIRKERHLSNENNISFSGNNAGFTNYSKKLKGNTLGAKLNQLLSVAADQTLNSMLGRDAVGESSSPSEKLRSIVPAGSFVPRYRRNSGVVQTASPRVLCSPLKTPIHNSVGGLNPDSISIKQ